MRVSSPHILRSRVPEAAFAGDAPLAVVFRGPYVSAVHRGVVAVADAAGELLLAAGDVEQPTFLRSAAKPFQIMPALLSGGIDRFGITERELAVLCSSHRAEPRHMEAVLAVLEKIGLDESSLHCGVHAPLDDDTARDRWRAGLEPSPVCNNCSGAHTGMLVACRANGWSVDDYGSPSHPLQRQTVSILAAFAGLAPGDVEFAVDNCAVPAFRLPTIRTATAFARLAAGRCIEPDLQAAATRVVDAMTAFPEMVAGEVSFDTALMRAAAGAVVSKGGAEGFQGLGSRPRELGLAMKVSDGAARAVPPVVLAVLAQLQLLDREALRALRDFAHPQLHNHRGETVGSVECGLEPA